MASGSTYWLGRGTVRIDGKNYKTGAEIPLKKVDKKKADEWVEAGLVGKAPFNHDESKAVQTVIQKHKADMDTIKAKLVAANRKIEELESAGSSKGAGAKIAKLEKQAVDDAAKIAELEKQSGEDNAKIAELEKQIESLTAPGADDKKDDDKKDGGK